VLSAFLFPFALSQLFLAALFSSSLLLPQQLSVQPPNKKWLIAMSSLIISERSCKKSAMNEINHDCNCYMLLSELLPWKQGKDFY
jgi:hypothetical protein